LLPLHQKWYKYNYSSEKYPAALLEKLKNPTIADNGKKLDLPPLNTLLPTNFNVLPENES
jgi:secreted Zn-dependent insulinase-like peptidase